MMDRITQSMQQQTSRRDADQRKALDEFADKIENYRALKCKKPHRLRQG